MRRTPVLTRLGSLALLLTAVAWLGACTDTVYRDRPPFNPPPDAASGFLGYFSADDGQTTCGNCHVDHQGDWAKHGHSDAYATLVNSGSAQSFCYSCHTVSENGNAVDVAAGWNVVQDKAYHDVQCESCHGPGETHVTTPDAAAPPLAKVAADTGGTSGTCGECHDGTHHPYVSQWGQSRHGVANAEVVDEAITLPANYTSCLACHEGRAALKAWGVTSNYAERDQALSHTNALGVTCAVCHDPHGNDNAGQLRFPVDDPSIENNLCMKCHARRFEPQLTSSRGPHAPQGPMFLGTAGWFPAGVDTTPQASTHGNPVANPKLCATCHVPRFTVTDTAGNFQLTSVGHLFRPIPCLDAQGNPVADNSCAYDAVSRNWSSCLGSGCHADAGVAIAAFDANRATLAVFADQIWVDLNANGNVDTTDTGLLALVKLNAPTEFSTTDGQITVAEGALFNVRMIGEGRYANGDKSIGVHNPFLAQKLLAVSIQALGTQYPFLPAPPALLKGKMQQAVQNAANAGHSTLSSR